MTTPSQVLGIPLRVRCWHYSKPWVSPSSRVPGPGVPPQEWGASPTPLRYCPPQPIGVQPAHIPWGCRPLRGLPSPPPQASWGGGNGAMDTRCLPASPCRGTGTGPSPSISPSPSPRWEGAGGLGGRLCPTCARSGQGPAQPAGALPHGYPIFIPITGRSPSSRRPGDAPVGVHRPALCLRARQPLIYFN